MSVRNIEEPKERPLLRELYLFQELTQRVLNDYIEAVAEIRLASASERGPSQLALTSAATRLLARAQAHRALQAPKVSGKLELSGYLEKVCAALSTARPAAREAGLTLAADEVWLDADRCWLVSLIIAELINTPACLGLSGETGAIHVRIADGGWRMVGTVSGHSPAPAAERGGRRLVEALAAELGGTIEWALARHAGCAWFEIPIERPARTLPT